MPTSQEIADHCGVSRTTVWAVLREKRAVSEATRQRVLTAVRELEYASPPVRRALAAHFAHVVVVVVRDVTNPYFTAMSLGVREVIGGSSYHMVYHGSDIELEEDGEVFQMFQSFSVAGYIVSSMGPGPSAEALKRIVEAGTPVVTVGGAMKGLGAPDVSCDFHGGSRQITSHLLEAGHRRISYLAGPPEWTDDRVHGFIQAYQEHGVALENARIITAGISEEEGCRAAIRVLDEGPRPTAIACFSDNIAMGVYRAARERGLRIPGDISVVGFDNVDVAGILGPPLTTVDSRPREAGRAAAEILLGGAAGGDEEAPERRVIPAQLVVRDSAAPVGPGA